MDFYEIWLGIPADRRPPTHYDLLGLPAFESDPATIEQAALRRMGKVRHYQLGAHSDQSQDILSELARARVILIDPDRRAEYDAKLKERGATLPALAIPPERGENGEAIRHSPIPDEAIPDSLKSIVLTRTDAQSALTLRPIAKKSAPIWKKCLVTAFFMSIHAGLIGCGYVIIYDPWNWRQNRSVFAEKDAHDLPQKLIPRPAPDPAVGDGQSGPTQTAALEFDGRTRITVAKSNEFDMTNSDYTIFARIKTERGGTIFSKTADGQWVSDGKSLFVRNGKLVFDIEWVDYVESRREVADGDWHEVAMTFDHDLNWVSLYVDGMPDGGGLLAPKNVAEGHIVRIAYTAPGYPCDQNYFVGQICDLRFYQRAFAPEEITTLAAKEPDDEQVVARWVFRSLPDASIPDETGHGHEGTPELGPPDDIKLIPMNASASGRIVEPSRDHPSNDTEQPAVPQTNQSQPAPSQSNMTLPTPPKSLTPERRKATENLKVVRRSLEKAQKFHEDRKVRANKAMRAALAATATAINNNEDMAPEDRVLALRELMQDRRDFEDRRILPKSEWMIGAVFTYLSAIHESRIALLLAHRSMIGLCQPTSDDAQHHANEITRLETEAGQANPFDTGSFWEGLRFMLPAGRDAPLSMRVEGRRGSHFNGRVFFPNGSATAQVVGEFDGFHISWETLAMDDNRPWRGWNVKGITAGNRILAVFDGFNVNDRDERVPVEGNIRLERKH